ncbi:hypothetical protein BSIN_3212 [Burkholderia singularis]|uniref:Uncharacterized protein n=1 Tax=Burkholderia singularis TaxID=1503053 RepID=A0A238H472_9BURK|nr:hypothetical protein BSIN_3212 [Burkholderia singularis]
MCPQATSTVATRSPCGVRAIMAASATLPLLRSMLAAPLADARRLI